MPIRSILLILFLLAGSLSPPELAAQGNPAAPRPATSAPCFSIEDTYPPTTSAQRQIPFELGRSCFTSEAPVRVTMRIYNVPGQLVTIPEAVDHPRGRGIPISNLEYAQPGRYAGLLDGRYQSGRPIGTGVYYVQLVVNGYERWLKIVIDNPRRRGPLGF